MSNNKCPYSGQHDTKKLISQLVETQSQKILLIIRFATGENVGTVISNIEQSLNDLLNNAPGTSRIPENSLIYPGIGHAVRNILRLLDVYHQLGGDVSQNGEIGIRDIVYEIARIPMPQLGTFSHALKINEDLINKAKTGKIDPNISMQHLPYVADHFVIDKMKLHFSDEIERSKPELSGLCPAIGVRENVKKKDSALFLDQMILACIYAYVSNFNRNG